MAKETPHSIAKRKQIIDAIVPLMDDDGLKNISVQDICAAAGISIGSFYHYFSAKDHIIDEMYHQLFQFLKLQLPALLAMPNSADAILALGDLYAEYIAQWGMYANRLTTSSAMDNGAEPLRYRVPLHNFFLQLTERACTRGDLVSVRPPHTLADEVVVLLHGCDHEWATRMDDFPIAAYIHTMLSTYLSALRPPLFQK